METKRLVKTKQNIVVVHKTSSKFNEFDEMWNVAQFSTNSELKSPTKLYSHSIWYIYSMGLV